MKVSDTLVFATVFLLLLGVTLWAYPSLPPGEMLYSLLQNSFGFPEITQSVLGFSGGIVVNGILNGVLWGSLVAIAYSLGRMNSKREVMTVVVSTPEPVATRTVVRQPIVRVPSKMRKITTYVSLDDGVEVINGIGPKYGNRLRFSGVGVVDDLLREGATWKGRRNLADNVGVATNKVFRWVNQADFYRIGGVGRQYADLLDTAGVDTIIDLSRRNPKHLYEKLIETNWEKNVVKRLPPYRVIEGWIQSAKRLESMVEY